ncbi:MAG: alpha/beta hydrolase [Anaerolineae bacterium]|nr:alpha/beta hydrolase [Anaerolineae bacterium]
MQIVTSKDGTTIAYDRLGQGAPIILVDGAMCHRNFGPMGGLAPLLAKHFTVFMYDRRGRGDSGDTLPYAVEREVEDIDALIQEAGGSAFVYGVSSGGALALAAAAQGLAISRLAVYEVPFVVDDSRPDLPPNNAQALDELVSAGHRGDAVEYFMVQMVGMPAEAAAPMRHAPMWPGMEAIAHTLVYDATVMGDFSMPKALLESISVPTLVMNGGETTMQLKNTAKAVAATIPNAQYRVLEGQTHDAAAEVVAPALIEFFQA